MNEFLTALIMGGVFLAFVTVEAWFPWPGRVVKWWRLDPAEKLYTEMISDLAEEDCWEITKPTALSSDTTYLHLDSGIAVRFSYSGIHISVGGETRRFSLSHPIAHHLNRMRKRIDRKKVLSEELAHLDRLNDTFRKMNAGRE